MRIWPHGVAGRGDAEPELTQPHILHLRKVKDRAVELPGEIEQPHRAEEAEENRGSAAVPAAERLSSGRSFPSCRAPSPPRNAQQHTDLHQRAADGDAVKDLVHAHLPGIESDGAQQRAGPQVGRQVHDEGSKKAGRASRVGKPAPP